MQAYLLACMAYSQITSIDFANQKNTQMYEKKSKVFEARGHFSGSG